jgi:hypothetical protein
MFVAYEEHAQGPAKAGKWKGKYRMKFSCSLSVLAVLAALVTSPAVSSAQALAPAADLISAPAPAFYAQLGRPANSSSSANAFLYNAPAQTSAPRAGAPAGSSRPFSGIAVGVKFGLAGVGFDVATPLVPQRLNLRGGASFFTYSPSTIVVDNANINGTLKFQNADVMVDFFPFKGRFRLSGGMTVYNYTNLSATLGIPTGQSITVGGTNYYSDPSNPLSGSGTFNFGGKTAGRVSIGTGNLLPKKGRFTFQSEVGVQFFSSPTVAYTFTGNGCPTATHTPQCAPIPTTSITQEQQTLQNDLTDLKYFPILSVGLGIKLH